MSTLPATIDDAVIELGQHIIKVGAAGGDLRKDRSLLGERHGVTVAVVDDRVSEYVRENTSDEEFRTLSARYEFLS